MWLHSGAHFCKGSLTSNHCEAPEGEAPDGWALSGRSSMDLACSIGSHVACRAGGKPRAAFSFAFGASFLNPRTSGRKSD